MQTGSTSKRIRLHESSRASAAAVMDPNLWSKLPGELVLKIYNSSEIKDFYQLREVCQAFNYDACSRRCFTDLIPKPYFVVIQQSKKTIHVGIIGYNISLATWMSKSISKHLANVCLDQVGDIMEPFTVEGILFVKGCIDASLLAEYSSWEHIWLADIRYPGSTLIGSLVREPSDGLDFPEKDTSVVGMMVDTSTTVVKVIFGTPNAGTLIFNWGTSDWEIHPSNMIRNRPRSCPAYTPKSCISCGSKMYIWADLDEIQVYSDLAEDRWSTLEPPPCSLHHLDTCRGLGHWQNEVYAVTRATEFSAIVWKLAPTQAWVEFERMPLDVWLYIANPLATIPDKVKRVLMVNHCGEYFLMHMVPTHGRPKKLPLRHVLFSLANKRWETVLVPGTGN